MSINGSDPILSKSFKSISIIDDKTVGKVLKMELDTPFGFWDNIWIPIDKINYFYTIDKGLFKGTLCIKFQI